ncbi:hypothetical protein MPSEU_000463800 [Mayamaea pseudoterrestris]|nr:hypothetical protein MPSEU_000463800 [Mayamaea pseudoterrestris]
MNFSRKKLQGLIVVLLFTSFVAVYLSNRSVLEFYSTELQELQVLLSVQLEIKTSKSNALQINKSRRYLHKSALCPACRNASTGENRFPTCESLVSRYQFLTAPNNETELDAFYTVMLNNKQCKIACNVSCADSERTRVLWRMDDIAPPEVSGRTFYLQSVPDKHRIPRTALSDLDSYFSKAENLHPQREYFFEYNPSILKIPDGYKLPESLTEKPVYLASFRLTTIQMCVMGTKNMYNGSAWPPEGKALGLALLRADFSIIADVAIDVKAIDKSVQDYRIFEFDNQLYLSSHYLMWPFWLETFNGTGHYGAVKLKHKFDIANEQQHPFDVYIRQAASCARYSKGRNGKNLNFFKDLETNEIMMELLPMGPKMRIDLNKSCDWNGEPQEPDTEPPSVSEATFRTMEELHYGTSSLFWNDRGSACCVSIADPRNVTGPPLLLGIAHGKTLKGPYNGFAHQYTSSFYAMESVRPYGVVAKTGRFCLGFPSEHEEDNPYARLNMRTLFVGESVNCPRIHFVSGMLEKADDPSILVIGYGVNDCAPRIVQVEKEYVIRLLFPTDEMELK